MDTYLDTAHSSERLPLTPDEPQEAEEDTDGRRKRTGGGRTRSRFTYKDLERLGRGSVDSPLRVVAHIDLDAFYAQCETVRLSLPPTLPLAVQQWGNLIAINYPARTHGLTSRHVSAVEALKLCPGLRLVHIPTWQPGDDRWRYRDEVKPPEYPDMVRNKACLDYYRGESRRIMRVVKEGCVGWRPFGGGAESEGGGGSGAGKAGKRKSKVVVEKASIDEVFLELGGRLEEVLWERYGELLENGREGGGAEGWLPLPPPDEEEKVQWFGTKIITEKKPEEGENVETDKNGKADGGEGDESGKKEEDQSTEEKSPPLSSQPNNVSTNEHTEPTITNINPEEPLDWDTLLFSLACNLISHIRSQIHSRLGYTCSAGLSINKLLSKLASSMHKPNQQTLIPPESIPYFLSTIKLTKLRNLGGKLGHQITETFGTESIPEIGRIESEVMARETGISIETARWVGEMTRGIDKSAVVGRGGASSGNMGGAGGGGGGSIASVGSGGGGGGGSDTRIKSMLSAKSFRPPITNHEQALSWLQVFVSDVIGRMKEEEEEDALDYDDGLPRKIRRPKTISLSYHRVGGGGNAGAGIGGRSKSRPITGEITKTKLLDLASGLLAQAEEAVRSVGGGGGGGFYPCAGLSLHLGGFEEVDNPMGKGGLGRFFMPASAAGGGKTQERGKSGTTGEDEEEARNKRRKVDHPEHGPESDQDHDLHEEDHGIPGMGSDHSNALNKPTTSPIPPPQLHPQPSSSKPPAQKRFFFTHPPPATSNPPHPTSSPTPTISHHTCKTCAATFPITSGADIIAHDDWHFVTSLVEEERRAMRMKRESESARPQQGSSGSRGRGGGRGTGGAGTTASSGTSSTGGGRGRGKKPGPEAPEKGQRRLVFGGGRGGLS